MNEYREPTMLASGIRIGVDVGGTKVAALAARDGDELSRIVHPTRLDAPESTLIGICDTIREVVSLAQVDLKEVEAIGLGFPGQVEPLHGTVQLAVNLNFRNIAVGAVLEEMLGIPCFLENDVRMAALGLRFHPGFALVKNLAYLSIGTGIAAGIIVDGTLYRGRNGMAGEIGHIEVVTDGPKCSCGAVGCLEAVAAGPAIETMMTASLTRQGTASKNGMFNGPVSAGQIFQMACDGDHLATEIVESVSRYLGWAIKLLVLTYDIEFIILGGGVARVGTAFLDPILRDIARRRNESDLARDMLTPEMIQLLPVDFDAPLWGGLALADKGLHKEEA